MVGPHIQVRFGFRNAKDGDVVDLGRRIITGMKGNPAFPAPPVPIEVVETALEEFVGALQANVDGGRTATARKNQTRALLIGHLRDLGHYVQIQSKNDLATLLSSGFVAASTNRAPLPLPTPKILAVINGRSTQLVVRVVAIPNVRSYEVESSEVAADGTFGAWQKHGSFTNSRAIPLNNLTPGKIYWVRVRAFGGSTGITDWSDPVSHMCM